MITHTDTQTDRHRETQTDRRQTGRKTAGQTGTQIDRRTGRLADRKTNRELTENNLHCQHKRILPTSTGIVPTFPIVTVKHCTVVAPLR